MNDWNSEPTNPPHIFRFEVGEIAIFNINIELYYRTPCEVMERGPMYCHACNEAHDYRVKLCDGKTILLNDPDLAKFEPPADELTEDEVQENEITA